MKKVSVAMVSTVLCCIAIQFVPSVEGKERGEKNTGKLSAQDMHALELGRKVVKVKAALQSPEKQASMDTIRDLGLDSRYYVMVRGWISQHISMTESYRDTSPYRESAKRKKEVDDRIAALRRVLRAIDLE